MRVFLVLGLILSLAACGAPLSPDQMAPSAAGSDFERAAVLDNKSLAPEPAKAAADEPAPALRITQGRLELEVTDLPAAVAALSDQAKRFGGYVSTSQLSLTSAEVVLRVPSERYEDLLKSGSQQGKTLSQTTTVTDVTREYYDQEQRLKAKRVLLERYLTYLRQAKTIEELLKLEAAVNTTTYEIETLEGSFRHLGDQIRLSTLTVSCFLPASAPASRGWGEWLETLGRNLGAFFEGLATVLVYLVAIGTPLILLASAVYFVFWGRWGLGRKWWSLLKGPKGPPGTPSTPQG